MGWSQVHFSRAASAAARPLAAARAGLLTTWRSRRSKWDTEGRAPALGAGGQDKRVGFAVEGGELGFGARREQADAAVGEAVGSEFACEFGDEAGFVVGDERLVGGEEQLDFSARGKFLGESLDEFGDALAFLPFAHEEEAKRVVGGAWWERGGDRGRGNRLGS